MKHVINDEVFSQYARRLDETICSTKMKDTN